MNCTCKRVPIKFFRIMDIIYFIEIKYLYNRLDFRLKMFHKLYLNVSGASKLFMNQYYFANLKLR